MSVRVEFIRRANQISMIAVVIQYALSLSLVGPLGERSFILGHAIATALTFPLAVRQLADASGMSYPLVFRLMLKMLLPGLALAAVAAPLSIVIGSDAVTPNVAMLVLWCSIYWFICYRLVLDQDQRWFIWRLAELAGLRLSRRSL
jgi:peptidoglycan biosynthesis protein MviN/MurJ (putative lipid II flippase)